MESRGITLDYCHRIWDFRNLYLPIDIKNLRQELHDYKMPQSTEAKKILQDLDDEKAPISDKDKLIKLTGHQRAIDKLLIEFKKQQGEHIKNRMAELLECRQSLQSKIDLYDKLLFLQKSLPINYVANSERELQQFEQSEEYQRYKLLCRSSSGKFLQYLIYDPQKLLLNLIDHAQECMNQYEHAHPINRSDNARKCLVRCEYDLIDISQATRGLRARYNSARRQAVNTFKAMEDLNRIYEKQAREYCNDLFNYLNQTFISFCNDDNPGLSKAIQSCFDYSGADRDFFDTSFRGWSTSPRVAENTKTINRIEKCKYEKACERFQAALVECKLPTKSNDYKKLIELTTLKDGYLPRDINFYSLLLNTAAQRLENRGGPEDQKHQQRLANLAKYSSKLDPFFKGAAIVGLVIALVGLALLFSPSLPAVISISAKASTAISSAGTTLSGVSVVGLWKSGSMKIQAANKVIDDILKPQTITPSRGPSLRKKTSIA